VKSPVELRDELSLRPLPEIVSALFDRLNVPPRLVAHHLLVHDVAAQLIAALQSHWRIELDSEAVLIGAAWHDVGKVVHPEELTGSGHQHEAAGMALLQQLGSEQRLARFARTHGTWSEDASLQLEDLLVALADQTWRGKRSNALEQRIVDVLVLEAAAQPWQAFIMLDDLIEKIAERADPRLSWQGKFPVK
jgi:putative nucleotidyltransferase with HDIG domain